jgi:NAD(P)-dependent dehydrogenase (short-subunit alcohol dehydrogenase family)
MNKRVLVTGSTKGIGQGILKKFHDENWDVCVSGRDSHLVEKLTYRLNQVRENSTIGLSADLAHVEEIERVFKYINEKWGYLDCVVFNIGSGAGTKGLDATFESNLLLMNTNLINTMKQFRVFLPLIKNGEKPGAAIFIGSIAQNSNVDAPLAYAYSKRAVNVFARYQALELAESRIRVNVINPGHTITEEGVWGKRKKESIEAFDEFISRSIPLGSIGNVEDIAEVVFSFASQDFNKYLTGQIVNVDGGTSLQKGSIW